MNISRFLYRAARSARDGEAIGQALTEASLAPIERRLINRLIGRFVLGPIGRALWWKP